MFQLDKEQLEKLKEWMDKREEKYCGAIGGRYTYSFTDTTLGRITKVTDNHPQCEETIDLTDYDMW